MDPKGKEQTDAKNSPETFQNIEGPETYPNIDPPPYSAGEACQPARAVESPSPSTATGMPYPHRAPGVVHVVYNPGKAAGMERGIPNQANAAYVAHQNRVIVTQPGRMVAVQTGRDTQRQMHPATGAMVLSCFVFWCCFWPLGLLAFAFAVTSRLATDYNKAVKNLKVSICVSSLGILVGLFMPFLIWHEIEEFSQDESSVSSDMYIDDETNPNSGWYVFEKTNIGSGAFSDDEI